MKTAHRGKPCRKQTGRTIGGVVPGGRQLAPFPIGQPPRSGKICIKGIHPDGITFSICRDILQSLLLADPGLHTRGGNLKKNQQRAIAGQRIPGKPYTVKRAETGADRSEQIIIHAHTRGKLSNLVNQEPQRIPFL